MNVLIAGCGYVGTVLARRLLDAGHVVHGLRRDPSGLPPGIRPVAADLADPASLRGLPPTLTHVVYAASAGGYTPDAYRAAYVDGVDNLVAALHAQGQPVARFVFTGSTGVYAQDGGAWVDETSPAEAAGFSPDALREGERRALESGFPATVVRLSGIYGPGRTRTIDGVRDGSARRWRDRQVYLNHIHRDDAAGVLAHVLALPDPRPLYLGTDDEPADRSEVLAWIAARLGLPTPPETEAPARARGSERRYRNARLRAAGYRFTYPTYREGYAALLRDATP